MIRRAIDLVKRLNERDTRDILKGTIRLYWFWIVVAPKLDVMDITYRLSDVRDVRLFGSARGDRIVWFDASNGAKANRKVIAVWGDHHCINGGMAKMLE